METLAKAMARLDDEMRIKQGVHTFSAIMDNATMFDVVSDSVDEIAKERNRYIGEKRWLRTAYGYELRVGYADNITQWHKKYGYK